MSQSDIVAVLEKEKDYIDFKTLLIKINEISPTNKISVHRSLRKMIEYKEIKIKKIKTCHRHETRLYKLA